MTGLEVLRRLRRLASEQADGELVVAGLDLQLHVRFQSGRVAWASSVPGRGVFVDELARRAKVDPHALRELATTCRRRGLPLGETVVALGLASVEVVRASLARQVRHVLAMLQDRDGLEVAFVKASAPRPLDPALTFELDALLASTSSDETTLCALLSKVPEAQEIVIVREGEESATWRARRASPDDKRPSGHLEEGTELAALRQGSAAHVVLRLGPATTHEAWLRLATPTRLGSVLARLSPSNDASASTPSSPSDWREHGEATERVRRTLTSLRERAPGARGVHLHTLEESYAQHALPNPDAWFQRQRRWSHWLGLDTADDPALLQHHVPTLAVVTQDLLHVAVLLPDQSLGVLWWCFDRHTLPELAWALAEAGVRELSAA